MESNQANNISNEDVIAELLTLTCKVDAVGSKRYFNNKGQLHRIYGPSIIWSNGTRYWCKNDRLHREDGPAIIWEDGREEYWINDEWISKKDFKKWQKDNGIKPIK